MVGFMSTNKFPNIGRLTLFIFLACIGFSYWGVQAFYLDSFISMKGSSPLHWLYVSENLQLSGIDWPTGTRNLDKSLPINAYWFLDKYFSIDASITIYFYSLFEILCTLFACAYFFQSFSHSDSRYLITIFAVITALCSLPAMNLANFGYPFHYGLYYSLAGATRIMAIACILTDRKWLASASIALSVMTHPLLGGIGLVAVLAIIISRGLVEIKKYLIPLTVGCLASLIWVWVSFDNTTTSSGLIQIDYWLNLTQKFNFHWYPIELGIFEPGALSGARLMPLISIVLLYFLFDLSEHQSPQKPYRREIRFVVLALVALTVVGVLISEYTTTPFLIKVALHRSGDLLAIVCFAAVLPTLTYFIELKRVKLISIVALLLLVSTVGYFRYPGFPLILTLILTLPFVISSLRKINGMQSLLSLALWVSGLMVFIAFSVVPVITDNLRVIKFLKSVFFNYSYLTVVIFACLILASYLAGFLKRDAMRAALLSLLVFTTLVNHHTRNERYKTPRNDAIREVQLWARENTASDALFMLDPGKHNAWRDLSRRSSYGTVVEWLHSAWLYDSDVQLFHEGVRRFSLLGLDIDNYLTKNRRELLSDASRKYNNASLQWIKQHAKNEGIEYFIFENRNLKREYPSALNIFENEYFLVLNLEECAKNTKLCFPGIE